MLQKMLLVDLILLQQDVDNVSQKIVELGRFETAPYTSFGAEAKKWEYENIVEKKRMISNFQREATELREFYEKFSDVSDSPHIDYTLPNIGDTLRKLNSKRSFFTEQYNSVRKRKEFYAVKIAGLQMYQAAAQKVHAEEKTEIHNFYSILGTISTSNLHILQHEFETKFSGELLTEGHVNDSEIVFISVPNDQIAELKKMLDQLYFINYGLPPEFFGEGEANMMLLGLEYNVVCDEEEILESQMREDSQEILITLSHILNSLNFYQQISSVRGQMKHLGHFVTLTGWVAAKDFKNLKQILTITCQNKYDIIVSDKDEFASELDIPSKMDNPKILKPFESLVSLFGIPNYRELDPTPIFSILYITMYGAMFGDVGQGALLLFAGIIGFVLKPLMRMIFGLMIWVGTSSTIFGALYGSYFGYELESGYNVPAPIWMSPIHNINDVLMIAIMFGIGVITLSYILGIINAIRMKDWGALFFSHKGLTAFVIYLIILTIGYLSVQGLTIPIPLWIGVGALSLFLGLERVWEAIIFGHGSVKDWWMGFFDMFEFYLSMLTNTLSFVRIGAFALTHAALMLAIFVLRDLAGGTTLSANIVVFIGNIFVIIMEGFIVGIQTLRLEYYEFFIRFFRGTGRKFNPISTPKK